MSFAVEANIGGSVVTMSQATDRFSSNVASSVSSFGGNSSSIASSTSSTSSYSTPMGSFSSGGAPNWSGHTGCNNASSGLVSSMVSSFFTGAATSDVANATRSYNVWMPQSY